MTYRARLRLFIGVAAIIAVGRCAATLWLQAKVLEDEARGAAELSVARAFNHLERWSWVRSPYALPALPQARVLVAPPGFKASLSALPQPLPSELAPQKGWLALVSQAGRLAATTSDAAVAFPTPTAEGSRLWSPPHGHTMMVFARRIVLAQPLTCPDTRPGLGPRDTTSILSQTPTTLRPGTPVWLYAAYPLEEAWRRWLAAAGAEVGLLLFVGGLLAFVYREADAGLRRVGIMAAEVGQMNEQRALVPFILATSRHDELDSLRAVFNQLFARVEATGYLQRRFLADAAHELRGPLSGLIYQLRLVVRRGGDRPAEVPGWIATALAEADRLRRLVDDVLDLSTLESEQAPIRPMRLDLAVLAREEAERHHAMHDRVRWGGGSEAVWVEADGDRVRQVIHNLVRNALRATEDGGEVVVTALRAERGGCLSIADTGVGMTEEVRTHVFNRFFRGDRTRLDGAGLGLAIVDGIVRQHGGSVTVRSTPGAGSTFQVWWPESISRSGGFETDLRSP